MNPVNTAEVMEKYKTGKYTVKMLSAEYGISVGKMFYILRDNGCSFIRKRRKPFTDYERICRSVANKGKKRTEEQKRRISEKNSCNYDGMNGYGHTKNHNRGYVLAYAPKHPHAHKDGYVMLHTILLEREIGRYLAEDEVVHHKNHNRSDNRIENLELMKKRDHCSMHMKERYMKKGGMTYQ
jgi:hypothetical protein